MFSEKQSESIRTLSITFPTLLIIVADDKGGCGKSTATSVVAEVLRNFGGRVALIDGDATNSSTATTHDAKFIDLRAVEARGALLNEMNRLGSDFDQIVMDLGARDEDFVRKHLGWIISVLRKAGARLLVVRPITSDPSTQVKAAAFAKIARPLGVAVLFVRNLGQGRAERDFDQWTRSATLKQALADGVVQCDLTDAGAGYGDLAKSFGMSFADVAYGRFERAGEDIQDAQATFNTDLQSWLAVWLGDQVNEFGPAIANALRS